MRAEDLEAQAVKDAKEKLPKLKSVKGKTFKTKGDAEDLARFLKGSMQRKN